MNPELPDTVFAGRYRLIGPIGRGAFGTVYKALDPVLNRVVAVKVLGSRTGWARQALAREAEATSSLTHPNILRVFDFFEAGDSAVIVVEFIEGRSLADILREGKPLNQDYVITIAAHVGSALAYAHRRRVIHRDVKPSNILISTSGRVVLTDFGLAIASGEDTLTSSGTVLGTPRYMSPEQAMGRPLDGRSDIYALAIVVYEALCGQPWFEGAGPVEVIERLVTAPVEPIRQRNPKVSAAVEQVLAKALSKEPADRYQTADQFVHALRDAGQELTVGAARAGSRLRSLAPEDDAYGERYGRADSTGDELAFVDADTPVNGSRAGYHIFFLLGCTAISIVAASLPYPGSTVGVFLLLLAISAWYVFRPRANPVGTPASSEPPETTEAAPYIEPRASLPHMSGQAFVDPPTAETAAYIPTDVHPTLTLQDPTAGSWLLVLNGPQQGTRFSLGQNVVIGRSSDSAVVLERDPAVSRRHAAIVLQGSRFHVHHLGSGSGTFVNNVKVDTRELRDRDEIRVGATTLLFISAAETTETSAESKRRLVEFSAIWNDLSRVAHDDE